MELAVWQPNSSVSSTTTAVGNPSSYATKQDWTRHRDLIAQLYEKQPLADVMRTMESQHGFRATYGYSFRSLILNILSLTFDSKKMYKTRIAEWGLDKKNKEPEMRAIVRKNKQCSSQGKRSSFRIRGRPVEFEDVLRYWERKGLSIGDVVAQRTQTLTPEAVLCLTPLSSPIATPEPLVTAERILTCLRDYFRGSFDSGVWVIASSQIGCYTTKVQGHGHSHLNDFTIKSFTAVNLFHRNSYQEAGHILNSASSTIKQVLLAEHPETFATIVRFIMHSIRLKRHELAYAILQQFTSLGELMMAHEHPIHRICGWLTSMEPSQMEEVAIGCGESMIDHFESLTGPMSWSTLNVRVRFIEAADYERHDGHKEMLLQDLVHECEVLLGCLDIRTLYMRLFLANQHGRRRNYVEAMRLGWNIIVDSRELPNRPDQASFHSESLWIIARSQYALGDTYQAVIHLREAIELLRAQVDLQIGRAIEWLATLGQWLVRQSRPIDAAQVQEERRKLLLEVTDSN